MPSRPGPGPWSMPGPQGRVGSLADWPPGVNHSRVVTLMDYQGNGETSPPESNWMLEFAKVIAVYGWNPPPFHEPIYAGAEVTVLANASLQQIFSTTIPAGEIGCVAYWGVNIASASVSSIAFRLEVSGVTPRGFNSITGLFNTIQNLEFVLRPVPPNGTIRVLASNSTAANIANIGARVRGWSWPIGFYRG